MEKHAEILAPAGGEAQLRAAVLCGADAVYLGLRGFNARAGAENFDENTLPQTVGWCHARGVRVYVTLNTLVTDRELPQWLHSLDAVAAAGVDGVLVQDLGLAKIIRQRYPTCWRKWALPRWCWPGSFPRRRSPPSAPGQACGARSLCTGRCA